MPFRHVFTLIFLVGSLNAPAVESDQSAAGFSERLRQRSEFVSQFAGEPVSSVKFRVFDGYEPLSTTSLIVFERGSRAYLLTVTPCWDLPWTTAIGGIDDYMTINVRLNAIATAKNRCVITGIRPLDTRAMKEAEKKNTSG